MALSDSAAPAPTTPEFTAFIGLDWGDKKHAWSLQEQGSTRIDRGQVENTPEAIDLWAVELAQRFAGRLIAVALEQARGAVIGVLGKYAYFYLYPVHSTTSANYRKSFSPSGAKSDPSDADMLLDLLLKHREQLRPLRPDTEAELADPGGRTPEAGGSADLAIAPPHHASQTELSPDRKLV
jgi:hypothetical protein